MSNYRTHTYFNLCFALPFCLLAIIWLLHPTNHFLGIFTATFIYGTLFMSPDVDLCHQIKLKSLKGVLTLPFRSYSLFFRHRGLSHSWTLGTLTRVIWLMLFIMLVLYSFYQVQPSTQLFLKYCKKHQLELSYAFCGFLCADWGHLLLDGQGFKKL